ncbi:protein adenylyltransferase SelO [Pararhizobium sp.]|uniref:protein adenylyltransferase SelO n=1 Tax=Pararhizobium sp. TaxID=1977563 RepID=UPI00271C449D|nr:YdiU family protein [Pararhizobium sp.]MDO9417209.1 YdiU family protein [Pararhizobium sp.]
MSTSQSAPVSARPLFAFDNSYSRLPEGFYAEVEPTPVANPRLIAFNRALAGELGLNADALESDAGAAIFSGNSLPPLAMPIAMAYAAHQFGGFVPQLGDGRAILLGEVIDTNGKRRDIQLKGAGPTPYSRRGDGRAALGPVLREYVVSEAMHALGLPTTRALAAVTTGQPVFRETALPGGVLTRVAASHVRIGTFQFFAARGDHAGLRRLAQHVIERHYPDLAGAENPILALLHAVIERQAALVARWMQIGFIHGVMNTDNMTVSGETIDYGPCAFMDTYDPATVYSAIDRGGRYAYQNQPGIAQWNLARLVEALLPVLHEVPDTAMTLANDAIAGFGHQFHSRWLKGMGEKIGLCEVEADDLVLIQGLLTLMQAGNADFTLTFRHLADAAGDQTTDAALQSLFENPDDLAPWLAQWRDRLARDPQTPDHRAAAMRSINPAIIPRNHRIEQMIVAAVERDDFSLFHELNAVLARPYEDHQAFADYALPPKAGEEVLQTFCGT